MEYFSSSPWLLIVMLLAIVCIFKVLFCRNEEPPGPGVLHAIGNVLFKNRQSSHEVIFKELSRKYGSIFTVHVGFRKAVVMTGWRTIKAAMNEDRLSDKGVYPIIQDIKLTHGIVFANGESWKEMRKFSLTNLKCFGVGKKRSQEKIMEEVQNLMDVFQEKQGKAFNTSLPLSHAVANVICSIIFGQRFEYDDVNFTVIVERLKRNSQLLGSPAMQLYNSFPKLFKHIKERTELMKSSFANRICLTQLIRNSQETLEPHTCRGLVDAFLLRKQQLEESGIKNSHYHEDNLVVTIINMMAGGVDSTSSTLQYGLLLMAKYPDVQDQVQEELDRVVGNRPVRADDAKSLPLTQAVVHETQRLLSVFPLLPRFAREDLLFQGYCIKKGTLIFYLMSSAFHDEDEWEKPHTFYPGHFLDADGNLRRRDAFFPFGEGSRSCIAQILARTNLCCSAFGSLLHPE